eukprot:3207588-Amphidinium_carterae.1
MGADASHGSELLLTIWSVIMSGELEFGVRKRPMRHLPRPCRCTKREPCANACKYPFGVIPMLSGAQVIWMASPHRLSSACGV